MPSWLLYTLVGTAVVLVVFLAVLIIKGKIVLGSIEIGWPPKITFVPKGSAGAAKSSSDRYTATNKGKIGNVDIEGAAPSTEFTADGGEIGDVKVKRKL